MAVHENDRRSADSGPWLIGATIFLMTLAATIVLVPAPLLLDYPGWVIVPVVAPLLPALGALGALWLSSYVASYKISAREYYLAWLGALAPPALVALGWPIVYALVYGFLKLFHAQWVKSGALIFSGLLGCALGFIMMIISAANLAMQLYPGTAGARSPFYDMNARAPRTEIGRVLVVILLPCLVLILYLGVASSGVNVALYYIIILLTLVVSSTLWLPSAETATDRIRRLLEVAGWTVSTPPDTQSMNSDQPSETVDLIAESESGAHSVFIHVITADEAPSPDWTLVFQHFLATHRMSAELKLRPESVVPALVFLDIKPNEGLVEASGDQGVRLLEVAGAEIDPILLEYMNGGETERERAAERVLQPLTGYNDEAVPSKTTVA